MNKIKKTVVVLLTALVAVTGIVLTGCGLINGNGNGNNTNPFALGINYVCEDTDCKNSAHAHNFCETSGCDVIADHTHGHFDCTLNGCLKAETHTHCKIDDCHQTGIHTHNNCGLDNCTQSGMHNHNCGINGCNQHTAHSHNSTHGNGHKNKCH